MDGSLTVYFNRAEANPKNNNNEESRQDAKHAKKTAKQIIFL
jgi:hypothetical protein